MAKHCTIGYTYKQRWSMDGKSGDTFRAIVHEREEDGTITRTTDYKVRPDFAEQASRKKGSERLGAPLFDQFGRLCGFMQEAL